MSEHTKARRIEDVELTIRGPVELAAVVCKIAAALGFTATDSRADDDRLPWRGVLGITSEQELPGVALLGARHKEGLSQRDLAAATGIPQRHVSEMETAKRPIGKKNARILARALSIDYRVLL
jgi:hypothetical protein